MFALPVIVERGIRLDFFEKLPVNQNISSYQIECTYNM